jgi:hypothetical protein
MENKIAIDHQGNSPSGLGSAFLKLPLQTDLQGLLADLAHCLQADWRPHYNKRDYEGGWEAIALRSPDGEPGTVVANPESTYRDTWLLDQCPHFQAVIAAIRCEKECVRLLRQAPGGAIKTHRDHGLHYTDGVFRLHIPLLTSAAVAFVIAGEHVPMQPGECWFGDFSLPHSVHNHGETERIHLVIDCIRNGWTDQWFADADFKPVAPPKRIVPLAEHVQMLAMLHEMGGETAQRLIGQVEAEILESFLATVLTFLDGIGVPWRYAEVPDETFLPGLEVVAGCLVIDRVRLRHVGDIVHEAGHVALLPAAKRAQFSGDLGAVMPEHAGDEMAVILWTYAVALHLALPLELVIHDAGYHGGAQHLRDLFAGGTYIGLPLLVWMGLCEDPLQATAEGRAGFPTMRKWMRD